MNYLPIHRLLSVVLMLLLAPNASFAQALEEVAESDKLVRIRPAGGGGSVNNPPSYQPLRVELSTEKSSYSVNEPIRFIVRSDKRIFLYMFNLDPATRKAISILPNRLQTKESIRYPGDGQWRQVPSPGLEFYSDRPGVERIIMVASERYLDLDKRNSFGHNKSLGDFYEMDSPIDAFDELINDSYSDDEGVQEKRIGIRQSTSRLPRGVVVKELNLRIH